MAEKPVECGECRRPNCVIYKEIVGDLVTCVEMCSECPVLQGKALWNDHTRSTQAIHRNGDGCLLRKMWDDDVICSHRKFAWMPGMLQCF